MSNRLQFTVVNGAISSLAKIICGVLQGPVLGPLLFLPYVDDIANSVPDKNIKPLLMITMYSSQLQINFYSILLPIKLCLILIHSSLQIDSVAIQIKTCYMVFSPRRLDSSVDFNLQLNGTANQKVKSCRYLGIIIDDELK